MQNGFIRTAAAAPEIRVADCAYNARQICGVMEKAAASDVQLLVLPELCLTGYTCGDLFLSKVLTDGALKGLETVMEASRQLELVTVIGLPLSVGSSLYNVAAVICKGRLLGVVPKQHIPNYAEFYEMRHFKPFDDTLPVRRIEIAGQSVPFGQKLLFACREAGEFVLAVEICEDLWVPRTPSGSHALAGATVIANLSASDEIIGKADYRRLLVQSHSARLICGYIYADAGQGESSTDLVFAGHNLIYENGHKLAESKLFETDLIMSEIDVQMLTAERRRQNTFHFAQTDRLNETAYETVQFTLNSHDLELKRRYAAYPFVPDRPEELESRCEQILSMQMQGLRQRLAHTNVKSAVIGLSGGLDSTLALLVTVRAFDALKLPRKNILAVTMPGFGTTDRTYSNALELAGSLGAGLREIPIAKAVLQHFADISQDPDKHDVTYENAQARERTQILMDLANQLNALVIGTGDLSELALGWATYNGDHMSMYGVNASVPKTLVRHLVAYAAASAGREDNETLSRVLSDILNTPVSPELLPPENGEIAQKTEHLVGPYALHDFFLYYLVRYGFTPAKISRLAHLAFAGDELADQIDRWLPVFIRRFFSQQFKRSCLPDGPKVGSVTLSPRGDWRMPSDACAAMWLADLEENTDA